MHLLTITLNPAIDMSARVTALASDEPVLATDVRRAAGGKGINMARVAASLGHSVAALFLAGGTCGRFLAEELELEGIDPLPVYFSGETRHNLVLTSPEGKHLKVNFPGPEITGAKADELLHAIEQALPGREAVALAGSVPPGFDDDHLARLFELLARAEATVLVDMAGPALALAAASRPVLLKPNRVELGEFARRPLTSHVEAVAESRRLIALGAQTVAVTDGPREALLVTADEVMVARPAIAAGMTSAAGMGDAFGVGYLIAAADGLPPEECFRDAMALGGAVAASPEAHLCVGEAEIELTRRSIKVGMWQHA